MRRDASTARPHAGGARDALAYPLGVPATDLTATVPRDRPDAPASGPAPAPPASNRWRAPALLASCLALGAVVYPIFPGSINDDTYAFLDWGRDLRHGLLPLLEHRTFQPLPVGAGAVLSLLGPVAPAVTIMLSTAALFVLAVAAWRVVALLGFRQPAPTLAALLVVAVPVLPVLAIVAYNNLVFATIVLWALVFELEQRRRGAWTLLVIAGLVRPEAWAFLVVYGAWQWRRAGMPRAPGRWLPIAALSLGPAVVWLVLEWVLFGDPLYSLHATAGSTVSSSASPVALWRALRVSVTFPVVVAGGVGAIGALLLARRRVALTTLTATLVALLTILVLAGTRFNLPSRHFSVLVALLCVLAAIGAVAPARLLRRRAPDTSSVAFYGVGLAGAALLIGFAAPTAKSELHGELKSIKLSHVTGASLDQAIDAASGMIDSRAARRHSVAMQGALATSELVWDLGVPYNAVGTDIDSTTVVVVQPSPDTWRQLRHLNLTSQSLWKPTAGWREIYAGAWDVYTRSALRPVPLRSG